MLNTREILAEISALTTLRCISCMKTSNAELTEQHIHEDNVLEPYIPRFVFRWVNRSTHDDMHNPIAESYVIHMLTEAYIQRYRREYARRSEISDDGRHPNENKSSAFKCITCDVVFTADHIRNPNSRVPCTTVEYYGTPLLYELVHKNSYPIPRQIIHVLIEISNGNMPVDEWVLLEGSSDLVKELSSYFYTHFRHEVAIRPEWNNPRFRDHQGFDAPRLSGNASMSKIVDIHEREYEELHKIVDLADIRKETLEYAKTLVNSDPNKSGELPVELIEDAALNKVLQESLQEDFEKDLEMFALQDSYAAHIAEENARKIVDELRAEEELKHMYDDYFPDEDLEQETGLSDDDNSALGIVRESPSNINVPNFIPEDLY